MPKKVLTLSKSDHKFVKDGTDRYGYETYGEYLSFIFELGLMIEKNNLKSKLEKLKESVKNKMNLKPHK